MKDLTTFIAQAYQITFQDDRLLKQAFTHSSYVNEHRELRLQDNERIEFLGDAVIELVISDFLFGYYLKENEGQLTRRRARIVCEESLAFFAKKCQFDHYVTLGKGEEKAGGRKRDSLLCDLFEAFIGAVYLDQGMSVASRFIHQVMISEIKKDSFIYGQDFKTELQELVQAKGERQLSYQVVSEEGPAHSRSFNVQLAINGQVVAYGSGKNKKNAEQVAAKMALEKLRQGK